MYEYINITALDLVIPEDGFPTTVVPKTVLSSKALSFAKSARYMSCETDRDNIYPGRGNQLTPKA